MTDHPQHDKAPNPALDLLAKAVEAERLAQISQENMMRAQSSKQTVDYLTKLFGLLSAPKAD